MQIARRAHFLPYSLPLLDEQEEQAVLEVLRSGWLTTGPKVRQFEEEFARYTGASLCGRRQLLHGGDASGACRLGRWTWR
jgi:hypothetical protein